LNVEPAIAALQAVDTRPPEAVATVSPEAMPSNLPATDMPAHDQPEAEFSTEPVQAPMAAARDHEAPAQSPAPEPERASLQEAPALPAVPAAAPAPTSEPMARPEPEPDLAKTANMEASEAVDDEALDEDDTEETDAGAEVATDEVRRPRRRRRGGRNRRRPGTRTTEQGEAAGASSDAVSGGSDRSAAGDAPREAGSADAAPNPRRQGRPPRRQPKVEGGTTARAPRDRGEAAASDRGQSTPAAPRGPSGDDSA
jgi:ribonuclease E